MDSRVYISKKSGTNNKIQFGKEKREKGVVKMGPGGGIENSLNCT